MNIIVCLDDNCAMAFGGRRQSMDCCVRREIISLCNGSKLWMNEYSFSQFESHYDNIIVDDGYLKRAGYDDFCFVETDLIPTEKADKIYAFFWNREYPSDLKLNIELDEFLEKSSRDFSGYSHKKITLKVYERRFNK